MVARGRALQYWERELRLGAEQCARALRFEFRHLVSLDELLGRELHSLPTPSQLWDGLAARGVDDNQRRLDHIVRGVHVPVLLESDENVARIRNEQRVVRVAHQLDGGRQLGTAASDESLLQVLGAAWLRCDQCRLHAVGEQIRGQIREVRDLLASRRSPNATKIVSQFETSHSVELASYSRQI